MSQATDQSASCASAAVTAAWLITSVYLFLPIRDALGAGGDGAGAVGRLRPDRRSASPRWSACSTTATRRSASSPASRMDQLGPRKVVPLGAATRGDRRAAVLDRRPDARRASAASCRARAASSR